MASNTKRSSISTGREVSEWFLPGLVSIGFAIAGWYAIAAVFPENIMPYPLEAMELTWGLVETGAVTTHLSATLYRTLLAFVTALIFGTALGVLMGSNQYFKQFFLPYILILLALPAIAAAVIALLIFRFSILSPVVGTVLITLPFVAINIWQAVEGLDPDLSEVGKSYNLSRYRTLRRIVFPQVAPMFFSTVRFGFSVAIRVVTIAEIVSSSSGVGYKIIQTYSRYQFAEAWAWVIVFMIVLLFLEYGILEPLERRAFRYRKKTEF